ncbi:MAG: MaoC family dehydratase [Bacteroidales bacterium]|nr:MaoC family dehydratase [Bacteroidales bacterium]
MGKLIINSYKEFEQYVGKELGISDYHRITQEQINQFADATLDRQWIHVDTERAKRESPYGATIAHGYLSVAMLAHLWYQIIEVNNITMLVNYGIESLRFGQAVVVNSEVRIVTKLKSITNLRGTAKAEVEVVLEIKGSKKHALKGVIVFLYQFK